MAGVDTNRLKVSTCQSLKVAGVIPDAKGNWLMQLFHHLNICGFYLKGIVQ
jgi:hypothetical protein